MSTPEKIIVTEATIESRFCPTIISGKTQDGGTVYVRYRWGHLTVRVDPRDPAPLGGAGGEWILEQQLDPEGLGG